MVIYEDNTSAFDVAAPPLGEILSCLQERGSIIDLAFRALRALREAGQFCQIRPNMPDYWHWLRRKTYREASTIEGNLGTLKKLIVHLDGYCYAVWKHREVHTPLLGYRYLDLIDATRQKLGAWIRRQLDFLSGLRVYRHPSRTNPKVDPHLPKGGDSVHQRALDANNRFSVLFEEELGGDEPSAVYEGYTVQPEELVRLSREEKKYLTMAETNETRLRMGYQPKKWADGSIPREGDVLPSLSVKKLRIDHLRGLNVILRKIVTWRDEELAAYVNGRIRIDQLSIVPLSQLEAYERWVEQALDLNLFTPPRLGNPSYLWDKPRVWETDLRMVGGDDKISLIPSSSKESFSNVDVGVYWPLAG